MGRLSIIGLLVALTWVPCATASGLDLDIHGALAQGFVISGGNNYLGDSVHGSTDFSEVAVNMRSAPRPDLLVSAQVMARKAGAADDGRIRIDYALMDWQLASSMKGSGGIRVGRVKNPYGFFNESRDVVFARPGVLLPVSIYYEGLGLRELFFSVEGAQLYGSRHFGGHTSSFQLGLARDFDASDAFERALAGTAINGRVNISNYLAAQWLGEWNSGRQRSALSILTADLKVEANDPSTNPFAGLQLQADIYVLSMEHLGERSALTFEYRYALTETRSSFGNDRSSGDGAYLQYRHYAGPSWEWYLRYDAAFNNRNDRDGRRAEATGSSTRHQQFTYDHALGLQWRPAPGWGIFAEYHYVEGTASVPQSDNVGRSPKPHWQMALLMLAYRF